MRSFEVFLCFLSCYVISFSIGYNHAIFNNPSKVIVDKLNYAQNKSAEKPLESERLLWSSTVAFWSLGAFASAFISYTMVCSQGRIGCKKSIYLGSLVSSIGLVIQFLFSHIHFPWLLPVGRLVTGFGDGIMLFTADVYLHSVTPPSREHLKRRSYAVAFLWGVLIAELLGFEHVLGTSSRVQFLYIIPLLGNIVAACVIYKSYDNPSDVVNKGAPDRAQWIMSQFFDDIDNYQEIEPIIENLMTSLSFEGISTAVTPSLDMSRSRALNATDSIVDMCSRIAVIFVEKCCGVSVFFYFSFHFLQGDQLDNTEAQTVTAASTALAIVVTFVCISYPQLHHQSLVPLITGSIGCMGASVALEVMYQVKDPLTSKILGICGTAFFFLFHTIGPRLVVEILNWEPALYQEKLRQLSLRAKVEWFASFLVAEIFPALRDSLDRYFFLLFALLQLFLLLIWIYRLKYIPVSRPNLYR